MKNQKKNQRKTELEGATLNKSGGWKAKRVEIKFKKKMEKKEKKKRKEKKKEKKQKEKKGLN